MRVMEMTASQRAEFADRFGVSEPYLYQCLTGRKDMRPQEAVRLEQESGGELRRWSLRVNDWWLVWPELTRAKGAPKVPSFKAGA